MVELRMNRQVLAAVVILLGVLMAAPSSLRAQAHGPAPAAPDHAVSTAEVRAELDHELAQDAPAMPQLDFRSFPSQIFWLAISFALLYWLLSRRALPRVADILETRQERIAADLDRAARIRRDAETALADYERLLEEAHAKAGGVVKAAQERTAADIAARQAALDRELGQKLGLAERRIGEARSSAWAASAAQAAVDRLAGIRVGADEARRAVDAALAEAR